MPTPVEEAASPHPRIASQLSVVTDDSMPAYKPNKISFVDPEAVEEGGSDLESEKDEFAAGAAGDLDEVDEIDVLTSKVTQLEKEVSELILKVEILNHVSVDIDENDAAAVASGDSPEMIKEMKGSLGSKKGSSKEQRQ